jgi:hypothetical protein
VDIQQTSAFTSEELLPKLKFSVCRPVLRRNCDSHRYDLTRRLCTRSSRDRNSSTGPTHVQAITVAHDPIRLLSLRRIHNLSLCPLALGRRMANLAAMTPQQSFAAPQASSQRTQGQQAPHGHPTGFSQSFNMPYDGSPHAHPPAHNQAQHSYSQSFPNGPVTNPGYARSFGDGYGQNRNYPGKPQIYTVRRDYCFVLPEHAC